MVWAGLVGGCGGGRYERPGCQTAYDDCLNGCAQWCEPVGAGGPETRRDGPVPSEDILSIDMRCAECVQRCRDRGEACDQALPPGAD